MRSQARRQTVYEALGRHPVHPFPARMAPGIALEALIKRTNRLRVLDPMMGSGTVLALARSQGHLSVGLDIDPLSVLIARVWTSAIDHKALRQKAADVLRRARASYSTSRASYPLGSDRETRSFLRYWFDTHSRRQLVCLSAAIRRLRDRTERDVLWCAFSRLIITKQSGASLAMDLAHSRPHKTYREAPIVPFEKFLMAVERTIEGCLSAKKRGRGPVARILEGDARSLPLEANSIDLVLTSPPYLNAIDYMRASKFSLVWMGHKVGRLRELRSNSVGTEVGIVDGKRDWYVDPILKGMRLRPALGRADEGILSRYIVDMRKTIAEVTRVLVPGGRAIFVVGENTVRGTFVRNSAIIEALAHLMGLTLSERRTRRLPGNRRYLPPPVEGRRSTALSGRMRREVVLSFTKPGTERKVGAS
jgi:DNA modification methylase